MKYRIFGKTGWKVSEIGFGAWQFGGTFGSVKDEESISTLLSAWDHGVNFVDTAQKYGNGHSEKVIGQALKQWNGDHIYIATKVQPMVWPHPNEDDPSITDRYPRQYIREQCEESLKRLGVEAIDLYQLHGWFPKGITETDWFDTLTELKKEGKIRAIGISVRDYRPEDGIAVAKTGMVDAEQVVYNLFEQRPSDHLLPVCAENDVAFIARVPFDEGALAGKWTKDTYNQFALDDWRRNYFKGNRFAKTLDKVEQLKKVVKEVTGNRYSSLSEVALRFCLANPSVSCVIAGMKNSLQLKMNVAVSDDKALPADLLDRLKAFNWPRNYHNPEEE